MIKATTSTSAGLAQVFDTSGVVQYNREKEAEKDQKLEKSLMEYNPDGIWKRDIDYFKSKYDEYMKFVADNHDSLTDPSDNIDLWQKKLDMENQLTNIGINSSAAKQDYYNALQLYAKDDKWYNQGNKDMIAGMLNASPEDYESGDAWRSISDQMLRNTNIDKKKYMSMIANTGVQKFGVDQELTDELKEAGYTGVRKGIAYDDEKVTSILKQEWDGSGNDAIELHQDYPDFETFKEDMLNRMPTEAGVQLIRDTTGSDSGGELKLGDKQTTVFEEDITLKGMSGTTEATQTSKKNWIGNTKVKTQTGDKPMNVDYRVYSGAVGVGGINNIPVSGNFGGFDISGGTYGDSMFRDVTAMTLNQVGLADYARQPMYMRVQTGVNEQQKPIYVIKEVKAGELVPKIEGMKGTKAEFFVSDGLPSVEQLYTNNDQNGEYAIGSEKISYDDFVGNDLFAFVQTTERVPTYDEESPVPESVSGGKEGTLTYRQGAVRWDEVKHVFQPKLTTYNRANAQISRLEEFAKKGNAKKEYSGKSQDILKALNVE